MTTTVATCSCGRRWHSLTQAHCTKCHEHFASVNLCDQHQTYDETRRPTCHDPAGVLKRKKGTPVFRAAVEAGGIVWRSFERRDFDAEGDAEGGSASRRDDV